MSPTFVRRLRTGVVLRLASANLSIGTASAFVVVTAALSLAVDRPPARATDIGAKWMLRGPIGPADRASQLTPADVAPAHTATQKVPA